MTPKTNTQQLPVMIQIDPEYIDQMKTAVHAIHQFVESGFKTKDFPMMDEDNSEELEPCLFHMLTWFNRIDPSWFRDESRIDDTLDEIRDLPQKYGREENIIDMLSDDNDDRNMSKLYAYIAYQMTRIIDSHKSEFYQLIDAIPELLLFTSPQKYEKALSIFGEPMALNDIRDIIGTNEFYIFHEEEYVKGIFRTDRIKVSKKLTLEKELKRFKNREFTPIHIIHEPLENNMIQEQAEINFFSMVNPNHIRYHQNRFQPSQQFVSVIKKLIAGLRSCNTPDDVKAWLNDKHNRVNPDDYTSMVLPSILARVFMDEKLFQRRLFNEKNLKKYTDSYDSIMDQDKNVKRFKDYNLFTTFKADKEGTIQFLEDFLSLKLVSDPKSYISNHTLLVLFNIFDSRIYLDILYNILPQAEKKDEFETEDGFVKAIRARINENSNKASPYTKPSKSEPKIEYPTSTQVSEHASEMIHGIGSYTNADYPYIYKVIQEACHLDISTLPDKAYNAGLSEDDIWEFIGESQGYDINGKVPTYMQERIKANGDQKIDIEEEPLPEGVPSNDINDLINSIDDRVDEIEPDENGESHLEDGFGASADVQTKDQDKNSQIVYNITYNYHNSNNTTNTDSHNTNTDSHNITTDRSINKTTGGTSNNHYRRMPNCPPNQGSNNYNNDTSSTNLMDQHVQNTPNDTTFSTGKSVQEVFDMLYTKEPLLVEEGASKIAGSLVGGFGADMGLLPDYNPEPHESLMVKAQDFDRKLLDKQEQAKKGFIQARNTAKAIGQPYERTKDWVTKQVDNILAEDEDKRKARMLEDKNYRTLVRKVFRIATDLGMYTVAFAISPMLGAAALGKGAMDFANSTREKKEVQNELVTELQIIDDKIRRAQEKGDHEKKYELMRIRQKMVGKAVNVTSNNLAKAQPLQPMNRHGYDYSFPF